MSEVLKWHREAAVDVFDYVVGFGHDSKHVSSDVGVARIIAAADPSAELLRDVAKVIKPVVLWIGPPSPDQWEEMADWFYRETGVMRPGKDEPAAGNHHSDAERNLAWSVWCSETKIRIWNELRAALARLAEAGGGGQTVIIAVSRTRRRDTANH